MKKKKQKQKQKQKKTKTKKHLVHVNWSATPDLKQNYTNILHNA